MVPAARRPAADRTTTRACRPARHPSCAVATGHGPGSTRKLYLLCLLCLLYLYAQIQQEEGPDRAHLTHSSYPRTVLAILAIHTIHTILTILTRPTRLYRSNSARSKSTWTCYTNKHMFIRLGLAILINTCPYYTYPLELRKKRVQSE